MINGFININKPKNITSNKVLSILKFNLRKQGFNDKIGHMGTLDPNATGVLPVALGRATRLFDYMLSKKKVYEAEFLFGASSKTLDADSEITVDNSFVMPDTERVLYALSTQIGTIEQIPPIFSAKNVNGQRAYALARKGEDVFLPPKKIEIFDIKLLNYDKEKKIVKLKIYCSGGTYIRAVGRDIAKILDTTSVMVSLLRTESGVFSLEKSVELGTIESDADFLSNYLIPLEFFLKDFPIVNITIEEKNRLLTGVKLKNISFINNPFFNVVCEEKTIGIGSFDEKGDFFVKTWLL